MPLPVRYAWGLLWLQGIIWGGLAILMVVGAYLAFRAILADQNAIVGFAITLFAAALTVFFAAGEVVLARALARGSDGARNTAIGVEIAMTFLGAMWAAGSNFSGGLVARVVGLAAAVGAGLSVAAIVCLLLRIARQHSVAPGNRGGMDAGLARPPAGPGSASCGLPFRMRSSSSDADDQDAAHDGGAVATLRMLPA
jgi:hypothetical protein